MGLLVKEHSLPKNSNRKNKKWSLFRSHLQRGDFVTFGCNWTLPACSTVTPFSHAFSCSTDIDSLDYCRASLFLLLSLCNLISTQQLNDILKCKESMSLFYWNVPMAYHYSLNQIKGLYYGQQGPAESVSIHHLLLFPSTLCSSTLTILLVCQCMENTPS